MARTKSIGDRVAYSVSFLKSIDAVTGEVPAMRGTVTNKQKVGQRDFCRVQWDGEDDTHLVLPANLAVVGPNTEFCAC